MECQKSRFKTRQAARRYIAHNRFACRYLVYHCKLCKGFHLTTRNK